MEILPIADVEAKAVIVKKIPQSSAIQLHLLMKELDRSIAFPNCKAKSSSVKKVWFHVQEILLNVTGQVKDFHI